MLAFNVKTVYEAAQSQNSTEDHDIIHTDFANIFLQFTITMNPLYSYHVSLPVKLKMIGKP